MTAPVWGPPAMSQAVGRSADEKLGAGAHSWSPQLAGRAVHHMAQHTGPVVSLSCFQAARHLVNPPLLDGDLPASE